jgi:hypothetical protein
MNPVLRWLDDPPKFLGLSPVQWTVLLLGAGGLIALLHFAHVPTTPSLCLMVLLVGTPTAFVMLGEQGGPNVGQSLVDAVRWRRHPHHFDPSATPKAPGLVVADPEPSRRARRRRSRSDRAGGAL